MKKILSAGYIGYGLAFLWLMPSLSYAQSDLFDIKTPNAMIIFDTSSSMNMDVNGLAVGAGNATGADSVVRFYNGGGDHPNSKLYQAKQALSDVLGGLENINLGFSTYGQFKTPYMTGLYVRDRKTYTAPTSDKWEWKKLYWRFNNYRHGWWSSTSFSPDSFKDVWGFQRTGMIGGSTFTINHTFDHSPKNDSSSVPPPHPPGTYAGQLNITVFSIVYNPEYNWYTFYYQDDLHDHYEETNISIYFGNNNAIDCDDPANFPKTWGTWNTYDSNDTEQKNNPGKWKCKGPNKINGQSGGFGNWWSPPEYWWGQFAGDITASSCPSTWGSAQNASETLPQDRWTQWTLVDPKNNLLPANHPVNVTGMSCFDSSTFVYPADGTANKPHAWSYFKMSGGNWPTPNPTYPAAAGAPGANDNHWFFINFPEVDDSTNNYAVKKSILNLLDLTPVQSPADGSWQTKLPMKTMDADPLKRNSITSNTSAAPTQQTPLADSLAMAKVYFNEYINNYKGGDAPSKASCRKNYVILLTDGLESCEFTDFPANTKVNNDLAPQKAADLLNKLGVKTFVIGFGKDIQGNINLNNIASSGGTDKAYFAANLQDLRDALKAIFQAIAGSYARSNPVVTSVVDKIYRAYFNLPGWEGHLVSYPVDSAGNIGNKLWDAGEVMNSAGRVGVSTWDKDSNPKLGAFNVAKAGSLKDLLNPSAEDIDQDGKGDTNDSKTIISFSLDSNYDDGVHGAGYYKGKRSATWKLGDIYHSTPLVVGKPPFNFDDGLFPAKYSDFTKGISRGTLIYVGANDGMLHAFNDSDGTEKFSVIPKDLLGNLKNIRTDHQFFVDSSPRMIDAYFYSDGKWHTVLISGERSGGNYYYAIDITDPNNPAVLWEVTDARMGNTWSRPVMGIAKLNGQNKFVCFAGGGYSATDNVGNTFYVIDVETGQVLRRFDVGGATNKVPAGATVFDKDLDGRVDAVYFGDLDGVLWKVKIDKEEDINNWTLVKLFDPGAKKAPIFYPPAVTSNHGNVLVYFGQGNELNIFENSKSYYFFEVLDQGDAGVEKWEVQLPNAGEKVLAAPSVANGVVYFTTWQYTGVDTDCGAGKGRIYGLTVSQSGASGTGGAAALIIDPDTGKSLPNPISSYDLGKGIPSAPVVTNGFIYISSSTGTGDGNGGGASGKPRKIPIPKWSNGKIKSWREVFE